jgi:hypothetical protein
MVIVMISTSGIGTSATDEGALTVTGSSGLNWVANIKNVSSKKATSVMAVISTVVLLRGTLTFGIVFYFKIII